MRGRGLGGPAVLDLAALGLGGADFVAVGGDFVAEAMVEELLAEGGQVGGEADVWAIWAAWPKDGVSMSSRYC